MDHLVKDLNLKKKNNLFPLCIHFISCKFLDILYKTRIYLHEKVYIGLVNNIEHSSASCYVKKTIK